jgi:serine/threonine-protein kinase
MGIHERNRNDADSDILHETMAILAGERLGTYEILKPIGAGGMGEVYQARDTRLGRTVAIKVLPSHLRSRPELRERFEREARTIAGLNHPHICTLYDVGHQNGTDYLVLEHLEGETLAERLAKGPLPLDRVLDYAVEISDALDKAHRKGITHRDLKPANIMLTKSGAKLLDFGVAKLREEAESPSEESPTVAGARPLTGEGTIVGTLHYMAPEQVEGRVADIDSRTDVFAFGAVVYEMVTGKKAFEGSSQASVIVKILQHDPPQPISPASLDRLVKVCLAKDPDARWQTATDVCRELKWIKDSVARSEKPSPQPSRRIMPWVAAGMMSAAAGVVVWMLKPVPTELVSRLAINLPPGQRLAAMEQPAIAISPDGKNLVYVAIDSSTPQQLYLRPLDSLEARRIAGTEGAMSPFFSPDGRWVGFFAGGKLKKVSLDGGPAAVLADGSPFGGASWSGQGTLAFQAKQALQQVSQEGGTPQPLTQAAKANIFHRWPQFLPGGTAVLFSGSQVQAAWTNADVSVQRVGGGEPTTLARGATQPRYAATGHLLYAQGGTLMAAPLDVSRLVVTGPAVRGLEGVMQSTGTGSAQYSVSTTGTLVYVAGGMVGTDARLAWVRRDGEEQLLPAPPRMYQFPRVAPDGRRIAVSIADQESQIWVYDASRDTLNRLTFEGNANQLMVWSPDGRRIAFRSYREGHFNLSMQAGDGSSAVESLSSPSENNVAPSSFSPDGQLLAFMEQTPETWRDIWVLNLADRKALPFLKTPNEESAPRFSPNGQWLAYSSDESGRREIYVQRYPGPGGRRQISFEGGQEPVWNPNGRELFYRGGNKVMAVEIETELDFSAGNPRVLFEGRYLLTTGSFPFYDVSPDGERFLMLKRDDSETSSLTQIHVVLNWFEELKQKSPVQ